MVLVPELMLPSESSSSQVEFGFCILGLWELNAQSESWSFNFWGIHYTANSPGVFLLIIWIVICLLLVKKGLQETRLSEKHHLHSSLLCAIALNYNDLFFNPQVTTAAFW